MQTDNLKGREDDERIDLIYSDHSEREGSPMKRADQLSTEEEANDSQFQSEGKSPYSLPITFSLAGHTNCFVNRVNYKHAYSRRLSFFFFFFPCISFFFSYTDH